MPYFIKINQNLLLNNYKNKIDLKNKIIQAFDGLQIGDLMKNNG
jgi:hypothetical protein